jgi:LCP family protein required for cell wall assembly
VTNRLVIVLSVLAVVLTSAFVIAYKKLEGNINAVSITKQLGEDRPTEVKVEGPKKPLNVLVMGSDSREGTKIGGDTPGLSDTTILLHLSADRTRAYGVSLPRDAMVRRPECATKNGKGTVPAALTQFNTAYAVGGPACTIKTVEKITDIRVQHYVVVNFAGFQQMVNAVNGVTVCVPSEVNDTVGHIRLPAGTYKVNGRQALDYVRVRHDLGAETGDIGRMRRQQTFISAMIAKVVSKGTLANPVRLYKFLDAATRSLTTDPEFAHLKTLASLGQDLKDIGLDQVQFMTVPHEPFPADSNRLQWSGEADGLWRRIRADKPLGRFGETAVSPGSSAGGKPGTSPSPSAGSSSKRPRKSPSSSPSASSSPDTRQEQEAAKQAAEEAGLCA